MITLEQLNKINEQYPNEKAYQILAGPNLTFPQFISGNRVNMVTTHLEHTIPLDNPESSNMSTGFEKSFGEYTDSYKKAEADFKVIAVITKNEIMGRFKYVYVVQNIKTKVYDIVEVSHYECLSESQGYLRPYTEADKFVVGDVIKKGTIFYKSNNHDEFENYRFGNNANCCYISLQEDEEDACIISESYAKKTTWHTFEKIPCTLQKNQILLNIYGDEYSYRSFPDIGEKIKDGMLYAKRTINYANAAAELTDSALRSIVSDDEVCAAHGYVADIDIWVNDREEFIDAENKAQIYKYYTLQLEFYTKVHDILGSIVNAKRGEHVQYTHKLRSLYEQSRNYLDINIQWQNNNNAFEFAYIVITTYEEKQLDTGYKITDRHGGKCIISAVLPDWMMPQDKYGVIADIIFSPPGTTARANPGQLYETEYNFCSEVIRQRIHALPTVQEKLSLLVDYVMTVNAKEGTALQQYIHGLHEAGVRDFLSDVDKNGIYLVQPPFMNTIAINNLAHVYSKFKIAPDLITVKQEFRNTVTGILLENTHVPLRKANLSLDKTVEKEVEYFDTLQIKDIQGKPIGMVSPFDYQAGEENITPDYFIGPDFHDNKESYFITSKHGFMKNMEDTSAKTRTTTQAAHFTPVKAFTNAKGFLVREYQSQRPVVIGKKYILVLKQNPDDKFSVRSLGSTNQVGIPNKPGKQTNLMSPYSKSSIRNGEMENDNFFIRIPHEYVHRYMATHSTNPEMIEAMAVMLSTEDPLTFHDLPIRNEDIKNDAPALMFHATLFSIGVQIKPIYKEQKNAKLRTS